MPNHLRELMLLRHAKSDWRDGSLDDIDRPLSNRGKKNANKMGEWLEDNHLLPDLILCSPALRTQQTLRRICTDCNIQTMTVDTLYLADPHTLIHILQEAPIVNRVMIIGHNPGLQTLFNLLTESDPPLESHLFPTCALAHLAMPYDWTHIQSGSAKLQHFVTPKLIKDTK